MGVSFWKHIKHDKTKLREKIVATSRLFDNVVGNYVKTLFLCNGKTFDLDDIAKRFANQRNRYAPGNLEECFDGMSLFGVVYMKYLIYTIQLRRFGVDDLNIQRAVNELFGVGMTLDAM